MHLRSTDLERADDFFKRERVTRGQRGAAGNADGQKSRDKTRGTRPVTQLRGNKRANSSSWKCLRVSLNSFSFIFLVSSTRLHIRHSYSPPSQITINSSLNLSCSKLHLEKKKRKNSSPLPVRFSRSRIRKIVHQGIKVDAKRHEAISSLFLNPLLDQYFFCSLFRNGFSEILPPINF